MLFLGLCIATNLSPTGLLGLIRRREASWGEVLGVEDSDLSFVDQNEEQTFREEEALVNAGALADIETIQLHLRLFQVHIHLSSIVVHAKLDCATPRDCYHWVALVSKGWR